MADAITLSVSAVNGHRLIHIVYADANEEVTERDVIPYRVAQARDGRTYVWAFCEMRGAERTFRTDRIHTVELGKEVPPERYLQDCKKLQYTVVGGTVLVQVAGLYRK